MIGDNQKCLDCSAVFKKASNNHKRCKLCSTKAKLEAMRRCNCPRYHALKLLIMSHYCMPLEPHCQCSGCKTTYLGFLEMDHIKGDGHRHFTSSGQRVGGWIFYK